MTFESEIDNCDFFRYLRKSKLERLSKKTTQDYNVLDSIEEMAVRKYKNDHVVLVKCKIQKIATWHNILFEKKPPKTYQRIYTLRVKIADMFESKKANEDDRYSISSKSAHFSALGKMIQYIALQYLEGFANFRKYDKEFKKYSDIGSDYALVRDDATNKQDITEKESAGWTSHDDMVAFRDAIKLHTGKNLRKTSKIYNIWHCPCTR